MNRFLIMPQLWQDQGSLPEESVNQGWIYREQVARSDAGTPLLDYYSQRYRHSSQAEWRQRIEQGQILVNGQTAGLDTVLQTGQQLAYHRPPWEEPEVPLTFEILYEDADLLVIVKPSGLPVLPGGGFLEHTLLWQLQQHYPQETPVPIHRLGRGTSGLLLLARSPLAKRNLNQQMRDRQIHKTYRALVGAGDFPDRQIIEVPIGKVPHLVLGYLYAASPEGQFAHSDCRVIQRRPDSTLLEVTILTGRPHQIRIHLAAICFPLLGDPLYGSGGVAQLPTDPEAQSLAVPGDCGYHLHAYHLIFTHPNTGQLLDLISPPPPELQVISPSS